jgi:hypothetical protein
LRSNEARVQGPGSRVHSASNRMTDSSFILHPSSFKPILPAIVALVFACLFASCKPTPIDPALPKVSAGELAESIIGRARAFSAKGVVRYKGGILSFAEAEFLCDPKIGLRIDFFTPFMTPAAILTVRENRAQFLNIIEGLLIRGRPKDLTRWIFHLDLDPSGLPWLLAGGLPPNYKDWRFDARREDDSPGVVALLAKDENGNTLRATLAGKNYRVVDVALFDAGESDPSQTITCAKHLEGAFPIPRRLKLTGRDFDEEIVMTLRDIETGKGPRAQDLILDNMPGLRITDI